MARNKRTPQRSYEKRIKEGRGQHSGSDYQPWVRVQDFSSIGQSNRDLGWKTGRQHDLLSQIERNYFLNLEWSSVVVDIQEQFPLLPLEETQAIANHCRITHPIIRETNEPFVLTTDFLITLARPVGTVKEARTVKMVKDLSDPCVIANFEIERRYWQARGIGWGIVTEREIDLLLARNVDWVHPFRDPSAVQPLSAKMIRRIGLVLAEMVTGDDRPLGEVALDCDDRLGLESGKSLMVARHMIASRQWIVDMTKPVDPCRKLYLTGTAIRKSSSREEVPA